MKLARSRTVGMIGRLETAIIIVLLVLMAIVLAAGTVQLVVTVVADTIRQWNSVHSVNELAELRSVFSGFLLILIGLELMKTIAMYLVEHAVHVEVVLTVAMIAVARHAINVNYEEATPGHLAATALLVVALTAAYYLYRRSAPTIEPTIVGASEGPDSEPPA